MSVDRSWFLKIVIKKILYIVGGAIAFLVVLVAIVPTEDTKQPPSETAADMVATTTEAAAEQTAGTGTVSISDTAELYTVTKVVDGDTLAISINGKSETIRLIGIDTPETVDPRTTVQCFGKEASDKAKELLTGKKVRIEKDPTQGERDKYDRLLAYVWREDGLFFNKYMVEQGYAHEYTYNTPYKYQSEFKAAQATAQAQKRGLWAPGVCETKTTPPASQPTQTTLPPVAAPNSNYICTANTYNCTDFSTHAEAQAVFNACGGVGNDIHRLDSDGDGDACESLP